MVERKENEEDYGKSLQKVNGIKYKDHNNDIV